MTLRKDARRLSIRQGMVMALLTWGILSGLYLFGLSAWLDRKLMDFRLRLRGEQAASDQIALVAIDDETFAKRGIWPLPRDDYALLLNILEESGAKAIGVDLQFLGRSTNPRSDLLLAGVTAQYKNIVHAISFPTDGKPRSPDGQTAMPVAEILRRHGWGGPPLEVLGAEVVAVPYPELLDAAPFLGHVEAGVDPDGCIRRIPMLVRYRDRIYPSLSLLASIIEKGDSTLPVLRQTARGFSVSRPDGVPRTIPIDRDGYTSIVFAGDHGAFRQFYSMIDVLQWGKAGLRDRLTEAFRGRIVLVGNAAVGEAGTDLGTTPFTPITPLLFVHANAVDAILGGRFLHQPSRFFYLALLGVLSLVLGWSLVVLSVPAALLVTVLGVLVIGAGQQALFEFLDMDVPASVALFLPPAAYLAIASYRYVFLERRTKEREKELAVARDIQQRLLPGKPPKAEGLDIFGANIPAQEVGGDYYDWIPVGNRSLAIIVGDVSGKGVSAALLMSNLQASCHAEAREGTRPGSILKAVNAALFRATAPMNYATLFLALIPRGEDELLYSNAGHNPGLLVRQGQIQLLGPTGVPVGMFDEGNYEEVRVSFGAGDLFVLYSDGVTECARKGVFYGEERLNNLVLALAGSSRTAAEIGRSILEDVRSFSQEEEHSDDVTLVVVRRLSRGEGEGSHSG